ncbi:unnamed protein product [Agarophyton chilense]
MSVDCYATVRFCTDCARNRVKLRRHGTKLKLFPARAPLEFVAIDILRPFLTTKRNYKFLLVITDRFSKLVRTVPLRKISALSVAQAFVLHWVFVYGPPVKLLSDNGRPFASRFSEDVCQILDIKNRFTTTYHPQTYGQAERFNRTLLATLCSYVADHPKDWDLFNYALTFAYNAQVHRTPGLTPLELVLSRTQPLVALEPQPTLDTFLSPTAYREAWKTWLMKLVPAARRSMGRAQAAYKRDIDTKAPRSPPRLAPDGYVFIRKEYWNPEKEKRHKLSPVADGPFRVIWVAPDTVVVDLAGNHERISRDRVVPAPPPLTSQPTGVTVPVETNSSTHLPQVFPCPYAFPHPSRGLSNLPLPAAPNPQGIASPIRRSSPVHPTDTNSSASSREGEAPDSRRNPVDTIAGTAAPSSVILRPSGVPDTDVRQDSTQLLSKPQDAAADKATNTRRGVTTRATRNANALDAP